MLSRRVGVQHVEAIEDAVQSSLMTGLESWKASGLPNNPSAWLFRVAHNHLMSDLRQQAGQKRILAQTETEILNASDHVESDFFLAGEVQDDLLRILFLCCDEAIPEESQLVVALKILCGFSIREISIRLFISEANVYKRFSRALTRLNQLPRREEELSGEQHGARLPAVRTILYLLFTEGYLSSDAKFSIRRELCDEAIRLASILAEHDVGKTPETFALLALMHLHVARTSGRQDDSGGLLLLEEQDRALWNQEGIQTGLIWLAKSAEGDGFSRYHAEAGIAAEHCLASSFQETRWDKIVDYYVLLEKIAPSSTHRLNRAVAVAEWQDPASGLTLLEGFEPPSWLDGSFQWMAVLADLHRRCGNTEVSMSYRDVAIKLAPTTAVRTLLKRRLQVDQR